MRRRTQAAPAFPDLCRLPRIALVLGVSELVVAVVALAPGGADWSPGRFVSASVFALWVGLTVAVLLCVARGRLARLPRAGGVLAAVAGAAAVAALGAVLVRAVDANLGLGLAPADAGTLRFALGTAAITALITAVLLRYLQAIDGWQAQVRASARAEADALQARIRPHFLFNSMNTIASLVRRDAELAERAVLDLSDLFRAALGAGEGSSTLRDEVALAERYLAIEALRLGPRLQVAWTRQEPLPWDMPLPPLVLQPLLENAVLHGVSRLPAGGTIEVSLRADADWLHVEVANPAPPPADAGDGEGARHARRSIGHRLGFAFGDGTRMTGGWDDGYYRTGFRVPLARARRTWPATDEGDAP
ncbi:sensor histidine kinase [Luteimonas pelagia]